MTASSTSPAALAYLGDAVCELCVRELLVGLGCGSSARLNQFALSFVRASAQAEAVRRILPILSEEEAAFFRLGRNHSTANVPKSATVQEYRYATGFEALLAALWMERRVDRLHALFTEAYAPQIAALREELGLPPEVERKDDPT